MSVPSFHRHFRKITTVSPLQFQKQMRLHIARNRLLAAESVGIVAHHVGYESLSQFNRDYRKFYGLAPTQDVATVRQGLQGSLRA
jgi:AraC-like DNA-binding protein